jgi:hypothetical protein
MGLSHESMEPNCRVYYQLKLAYWMEVIVWELHPMEQHYMGIISHGVVDTQVS